MVQMKSVPTTHVLADIFTKRDAHDRGVQVMLEGAEYALRQSIKVAEQEGFGNTTDSNRGTARKTCLQQLPLCEAQLSDPCARVTDTVHMFSRWMSRCDVVLTQMPTAHQTVRFNHRAVSLSLTSRHSSRLLLLRYCVLEVLCRVRLEDLCYFCIHSKLHLPSITSSSRNSTGKRYIQMFMCICCYCQSLSQSNQINQS